MCLLLLYIYELFIKNNIIRFSFWLKLLLLMYCCCKLSRYNIMSYSFKLHCIDIAFWPSLSVTYVYVPAVKTQNIESIYYRNSLCYVKCTTKLIIKNYKIRNFNHMLQVWCLICFVVNLVFCLIKNSIQKNEFFKSCFHFHPI